MMNNIKNLICLTIALAVPFAMGADSPRKKMFVVPIFVAGTTPYVLLQKNDYDGTKMWTCFSTALPDNLEGIKEAAAQYLAKNTGGGYKLPTTEKKFGRGWMEIEKIIDFQAPSGNHWVFVSTDGGYEGPGKGHDLGISVYAERAGRDREDFRWIDGVDLLSADIPFDDVWLDGTKVKPDIVASLRREIPKALPILEDTYPRIREYSQKAPPKDERTFNPGDQVFLRPDEQLPRAHVVRQIGDEFVEITMRVRKSDLLNTWTPPKW